MGVFFFFFYIMRSNVNALLAGVMADAKEANRKVENCEEEIRKYTTAAQNALKAGNEGDARKLIAKKQQLEEQLTSLKKTAEINNANAGRVHQMHDKLVSDIEALETKRDTIKATAATARAQEKINKMQDGGKRAASGIDAFNRMEAKANKALDQAMAHSELNAGVHTSEDLLDKYAGGGSTSSVDDELAAMKAQLGN